VQHLATSFNQLISQNLLLARLMGQYWFARWCLSASSDRC